MTRYALEYQTGQRNLTLSIRSVIIDLCKKYLKTHRVGISVSEIYSEIGKLLYELSPDNSQVLFMNASLTDDDSVGTFEYDYIDSSGNKNWFSGSGLGNGKMLNLLVKLRREFSSRGDGLWNEFQFKLDLKTKKFEVNFVYPNQTS